MQSPMLYSPHPNMCSTPEARLSSSDSSFYQPEVKRRKKLISYTCSNCIEFLEANGLASFIPQFIEAEVDGPLLASLCHPNLGYSILQGMGISELDGVAIVEAVKKEISDQ